MLNDSFSTKQVASSTLVVPPHAGSSYVYDVSSNWSYTVRGFGLEWFSDVYLCFHSILKIRFVFSFIVGLVWKLRQASDWTYRMFFEGSHSNISICTSTDGTARGFFGPMIPKFTFDIIAPSNNFFLCVYRSPFCRCWWASCVVNSRRQRTYWIDSFVFRGSRTWRRRRRWWWYGRCCRRLKFGCFLLSLPYLPMAWPYLQASGNADTLWSSAAAVCMWGGVVPWSKFVRLQHTTLLCCYLSPLPSLQKCSVFLLWLVQVHCPTWAIMSIRVWLCYVCLPSHRPYLSGLSFYLCCSEYMEKKTNDLSLKFLSRVLSTE